MSELTKKIQQKELQITEYVAEACEKLGIKYYIAYGTLIGAVRHQGFIPWDDDVDIWMLRDDYDVFIAEGQKYLPDHLLIQHYTTEPNVNNLFVKVRDTKTLFLEETNADVDINHGIFIDIYPIERIKKGITNGHFEFLKRFIFNRMNECYDLGYVNSIIRPSKRFAAKCIRKIVRIMPRNEFLKKEDMRRLKNHRKGGGWFLTGYYGYGGILPYTTLEPIKQFAFEETTLTGPENYDIILKSVYNDYMTLPPIEQRETHKPLKVEFDI